MNKISRFYTLSAALLLMLCGSLAIAQDQNTTPVFKQEELEQLLAPVALYPDSLLSQILMASTYPLEVVQADRWVKQNKDLKADALAAALEKENWDPSVKSLVNFPQVLTMMSEKLDWTQKLGDAFLAQQKDVLDTAQKLRKKASDQNNLKTTEEQVVKVEQEKIIIESPSPQVVYVPTYNPTVIYGPWPYPAYPPYYYYPPGYVATSNLISFGIGVAIGAAWGYSWGHCDWHGGDIDIDVNRNFDFNRNIDRGKYAQQYKDRGNWSQADRGKWQHNPANRGGVAYRDQATAQKFNRASTTDAVKSREAFRGRAEQGRQDIARGGVSQQPGSGLSQKTGSGLSQKTGSGASQQIGNRQGTANKPAVTQRPAQRTASPSPTVRSPSAANRGGAFQGMNSGSAARVSSSRGQMSRQAMPAGPVGGSRPSGGMRTGGGGRRR